VPPSSWPSKNVVTVLKLSHNAQKLLNLPKLPCLVNGSGLLTQPGAILKCLAGSSQYTKILENVTPLGKAEIDQWLSFLAQRDYAVTDAAAIKTLNGHLQTRTFMAANNVTLADLGTYPAVHQWMVGASAEERLAHCNVTRWFDHIQHLPGISKAVGHLTTVDIHTDPVPAAAAAGSANGNAAAGGADKSKGAMVNGVADQAKAKAKKAAKEDKKKERAEKKAENSNNKAPERPVEDVTRLDVRVGQITKVWQHPEADKLYCEEIDIGEEKPRQIASGLVPYVPIEQMQDAMVVVLCNLKAKNLKGFPSHGMVLCASSADKSNTELIRPPPEAKIGDRIAWEGLEGEPDEVLNDKKNPFSKVQPDFRTSTDKIALYKDHRFMTPSGPCFCDSIVGGTIS